MKDIVDDSFVLKNRKPKPVPQPAVKPALKPAIPRHLMPLTVSKDKQSIWDVACALYHALCKV